MLFLQSIEGFRLIVLQPKNHAMCAYAMRDPWVRCPQSIGDISWINNAYTIDEFVVNE